MSTPPRHLPRFLPTLTEVVRPSDLQGLGPSLPPDSDALVQTLQVQVNALVKERVAREFEILIRSVVAEKVNSLSSELQTQLREEVRKLVIEALSAHTDSNKFKS